MTVVFVAAVIVVVHYSYNNLPEPRLDAQTPPQEFSEERAWAHLAALEVMGVRSHHAIQLISS